MSENNIEKFNGRISFLVGDIDKLHNIQSVKSLPMFSDEMVSFLSALSREIMADKRSRRLADVMSYAYWIRRASIEKQMEKYPDSRFRLGRGVAFHIAPSNVPVNFAVSMTSALLAGNACIIRLSNKPFEQVDIITDAMNRLLKEKEEFKKLADYFCLVRYEHSEEITEYLSSLCDVRIIWGGDATINTIRRAHLPERAIEMTFADRHSLAVIDADEYLKQDKAKVADGFYTDTYYTDQNACSSPRMVCWTSKEFKETGSTEAINKAKEVFWSSLANKVSAEYDMKPIQAVDKFTSFSELAMSETGKEVGARLVSFDNVIHDNVIMRIEVDSLSDSLMDYKNGGGYFFEYEMKELKELVPVLGKRCQTISVLGIAKEDVLRLVMDEGVRGVDRIVPLGETMGLEFVWDGYRMIEAMTRIVYVNV